MSRDSTLIFGPIDICTVNRRPPVGLCLDSNEDRGTTEHLAKLTFAVFHTNRIKNANGVVNMPIL